VIIVGNWWIFSFSDNIICSCYHAQVINMSLGGQEYSSTGFSFYRNVYKKNGRIVVAAAGNGGTSEKLYPAS